MINIASSSVLVLVACMCVRICFSQNLTTKCERDVNRYLNSTTEAWAIRMRDATGRIESGRLEGNLVYEGNYRECIKVRENKTNPEAIRGLYCIGIWRTDLNPNLETGQGFCIPHSCTDEDAKNILQNIYVTPLPPRNANVECRRDPVLSEDPAAIVTITILCLFGVIVIAATTFDVIIHYKPCTSLTESTHQDNITRPENGSINGNPQPSDVTDTKAEGCGNRKDGSDNVAIIADDENEYIKVIDASVDGVDIKMAYIEPQTRNGCVSDSKHGNSYNLQTDQTVPDQKSHKQGKLSRLLLSFSLYTNIPHLLAARHHPGSFECLNGLRFLAMSWIILGHTYQLGLLQSSTPTVENRIPMQEALRRLSHEAINQMGLSVETFFVMSGMLVTISFMKTVQRQGNKVTPRQMALYYFHRYWRLTPVYAVLLMFTSLVHYFGSGPFFPNYFPEADSCKDVWWRHLLYIQTLFPTDTYKPCLPHTWYLALDFEFYVMAPAFVSIACFFPKIGLVSMILGYLGSLTANIVLRYQLYSGNKEGDFFMDIYIKPWTRATTYFIGMMLGLLIFHRKQRKFRLPKVAILLGWLFALTMIPFSVYGVRVPETLAGGVALSSIQTSSLGLAVAWIIFACTSGYGGIINVILSWRAWIPLSRLTYTGYMIHPLIIYYFVYTSPKQLFVYDWFVIYMFFGTMCVSLGVAFILTLVFEIPMMGMETVIIPKKKNKQ